jgi:deferrochelatase/peroxidase EfeB
MKLLESTDIQRLVLDGYGAWRQSAFALLRIAEPSAARRWLAKQLADVAAASESEARVDAAAGAPAASCDRERRRAAIAFSAGGLAALLRDPEALGRFPAAFREGMTAAHRSRALGDVGDNAPANWRWGSGEHVVDVLLCLFFRSEEGRDALWREYFAQLGDPASGLTLVEWVFADARDREPFGFRDGISQPYVLGSSAVPAQTAPAWNWIAAGEFVLGYPNQLGKHTRSPWIDAVWDPAQLLEPCRGAAADEARDHEHAAADRAERRRDLGRNGSFLVVRELEQDVAAFAQLSEQDAALLLGRWRDGTPLCHSPADARAIADGELPRPRAAAAAVPGEADPELNSFTYYARDRAGLLCPKGAHARRAFPRDALADPEADISPAYALEQANLHRILRRGRTFQRPASAAGSACTGLFFLCLNADIERQFEFVQQSWLQREGFAGLRGESDPLLGRGAGRWFSVPQPFGQRRIGLADYVVLRGGGYFFLPGLRVLRFLLNESALR